MSAKNDYALLIARLLNALQVCQPEEMTTQQSNAINNAVALLPEELRQQWFDCGTFSDSQFRKASVSKAVAALSLEAVTQRNINRRFSAEIKND